MGFLTPWFWGGLAALAVPIVVHLMHRERRDVVAFPSLMFLRKIPYHSLRRQKLRHLLLLALRVLALVLIVAAFARPFLARGAAAAGIAAPSAREVVVLLDRSYSMGYGDRWERARSAARRAIDGLGAADRATLVLFSGAAAAVTERTANHSALLAAVERAALGHGITRYAPAVRVAQGILEKSDLPRHEVVLISDFQKGGWDGRDAARLPEGTALRMENVADGETANIAVVSGSVRRERGQAMERVLASARIVNRSPRSADRLEATLEINGRRVESRRLSLNANGSTAVSFGPVAIPDGGARGTIRVGSDALPRDNAFHFVVNRGRTLSLLIVEPDETPGTTSLYLRRALAIGDEPAMTTEVRKTSRLSTRDLDGRALVILNSAPFPTGEVGRRLAEMVRKGAGILVVLGERSAPQRWSADAATLAGVRVGAPVERSGERGGALGSLDRSHPIFAPFAAPRSGDFASARFYRLRALDPADSTAVLARFDDGAAALTEHRVGRGSVLVWASTLDNFWNDLALQPVFLPFVHQLVRHATGWIEERPWQTVGDVTTATPPKAGVEAAALTGSGEFTVLAPSGARRRIAAADAGSIELDEQGLYEIRRAGERAGQPRWVAANLDPREGELTPLDPQELALALAGPAPETKAADASSDVTREELEGRQRLWWLLLAGALLCLLAETMLSNRLPGAAR